MKNWLKILLIVICSAIFLYSGFMLISYFAQSQQNQSEFDELASLVQQAKPTEPAVPQATTSPVSHEPESGVPTEPEILPEYAELSVRNPDMVGWICIEGTKINYPVMQTPEDTDYYLRRNFYGKYSSHGCIYAREQCCISPASDNITIYGHNMKDGSMFASLLKYKNDDFWEKHRFIIFDTLTEHHTYEIFAVFITTANKNKGFAYHQFIDAKSPEHYDQYVSECLRLSLYDTGIKPQYGEKLIALSTCEYTQNNGRLVVVARQIS